MTKIIGTPSIRTRPNSPAAAQVSNTGKAAAAASGKTLTKAGGAPSFPAVNLEDRPVRNRRRARWNHASAKNIEIRSYSVEKEGRQPDHDDEEGVVGYATDLIMVGWVFVLKRAIDGKNWLAPDSTARQRWGRQPDWNDVLILMKKPSEYGLHRGGECANRAWDDAKDALLRVFKRKPPKGLKVFSKSREGYMKFYFESLGPEELVLVSFHD